MEGELFRARAAGSKNAMRVEGAEKDLRYGNVNRGQVFGLNFCCLRSIPDLPQSHVGLNIDEAEKALGKSVSKAREEAWLQVLVGKSAILIDMPDYSKSDHRSMTSDLNEIYWLWDQLAASKPRPNLVIAVQKEMLRDHFFFDKMHKIELKPLKPEKMIEAYERLCPCSCWGGIPLAGTP